jgi:hypothetical protein
MTMNDGIDLCCPKYWLDLDLRYAVLWGKNRRQQENSEKQGTGLPGLLGGSETRARFSL